MTVPYGTPVIGESCWRCCVLRRRIELHDALVDDVRADALLLAVAKMDRRQKEADARAVRSRRLPHVGDLTDDVPIRASAGSDVSTTRKLELVAVGKLRRVEMFLERRTGCCVPALNVCDGTNVVASARARAHAANAVATASELAGKVRYTKLFSIKSGRFAQRVDAVESLPRQIEIRAAEVAVGRRLLVDRAAQIADDG